ncbi:MAG: biotin--[acetyl-CoA-carboxylase] ligase [Chitinophagales bacterium]
MEIKVNNTFFTGKFLLHLPSVDSTNNYAKEFLAKSSPIDGTVILADEQFAGRGQSGTIWLADANKNLTFSIIYHTSFLRATEQFYLNMAISLGISYALHSIIQLYNNSIIQIKWPNDIYANNKKIAGILIENTISGMNLKYSVIGIGLNVNQENFPKEINATSFKTLLGKDADKNIILDTVLASIEKYFLLLKERKFDRLKKEYIENLFRYKIVSKYKKGEEIFEGSIIDIDEIGNLMLETTTGIQKFRFKEISFL